MSDHDNWCITSEADTAERAWAQKFSDVLIARAMWRAKARGSRHAGRNLIDVEDIDAAGKELLSMLEGADDERTA